MTEPTEYPGMEGPLVERIAWARYTGVMSQFAKKALKDAEAALREQGDEHHTLDELYEYRMLYNALAANEWAAHGTYPVVKSWRHSDGEECFGGGWFIVVATLPTGQVSNHYAAEHWGLFSVPEVETPPEYDGHDPAEAARRMGALLSQPISEPHTLEDAVPQTKAAIERADLVLGGFVQHDWASSVSVHEWYLGELRKLRDALAAAPKEVDG